MPQPRIKDIKEPLVAPSPESFLSPDSSNIAGAIYQPTLSGQVAGKPQYEDGTMLVFFHDRAKVVKSVYKYHHVPKTIWHDFKAADSKGRYFIAYIKELPCIKVEPDAWPILQ